MTLRERLWLVAVLRRMTYRERDGVMTGALLTRLYYRLR